MVLPERDALVAQAWGDVPVSYFQDAGRLSACSFLDIKVNKWELNSEWSREQGGEPFIRIELLREDSREDMSRVESFSPPMDGKREALIVFELDDGGNEVDEVLLLRLVSFFAGGSRIYRWSDGFHEVTESIFASLPTREIVHEWLQMCDWPELGEMRGWVG